MFASRKRTESIPKQPTGAFLEQERSRRSFFRTLGKVALVTAAAIEADSLVGQFIWGGTNPEVHMLPDAETEKRMPRHLSVVLGGFGVSDVLGIAKAIQPSLRHFGQVAYIQNSNAGVEINDQKRALRGFVKDRGIEVVKFYGHSMAGMEAVELADDLQSEGVYVDGIYYDCTPQAWPDVRPAGRSGAQVLAVAGKLGVTGGPVMRTGIEFAERTLIQHRDDFWECGREALQKISPANCSNDLIISEADYLYQFRAEDFSHNFTAITTMNKLGPQNPNNDQTVNNVTADIGWQEQAFPHLSMNYGKIAGGGHADPGSCTAEYNKVILEMGAASGFYNATANSSHSYFIPSRHGPL